MKIHPVVNISCVKPYKERLPGQPLQKPGPMTVTEDHDVEYEIEHIIDSYWKGRQLKYLVYWLLRIMVFVLLNFYFITMILDSSHDLLSCDS